mgnify:CR=1 FL=1
MNQIILHNITIFLFGNNTLDNIPGAQKYLHTIIFEQTGNQIDVLSFVNPFLSALKNITFINPWFIIALLFLLTILFVLLYLIRQQQNNNHYMELELGGMKQELEDLRMREIKQSALIGQIPFSLYIFDREGDLKRISNHSGSKPFAAIENQNIGDILDKTTANRFIAAADSLFNRNSSEEFFFETHDGTAQARRWKTRITNIDNNNYLAIIEQYQEEENEISELKQKAEQLEETSQSKDQFLSILAHDLRSPFNALLGFSNLLMEDYENQSEEDMRQYIKQIYKSSEQLYHLLINLLHWTRLQTGKIKYTPFEQDIIKPVKDSVAEITQYALEKGIEIKTKSPEKYTLLHDASMISGAVLNLLSNAVKFSERDSIVYLTVEEKTNGLIIEVKDEGVGMDIKDTDQLFRIDRSFKETGTDNETGTGLGLILSKEFVSQHGGRITAKTKRGEGSTFTIHIPYSREDS